MRWLTALRRWQAKRREPWPTLRSIDSQGLNYSVHGIPHRVNWASVIEIHVQRVPTASVELFYTYLVLDCGNWIGFESSDALHSDFCKALFAYWPEIESSYNGIYCGSPNEAEFDIL